MVVELFVVQFYFETLRSFDFTPMISDQTVHYSVPSPLLIPEIPDIISGILAGNLGSQQVVIFMFLHASFNPTDGKLT